jgi:hypothetical protein
MSRFSYFWVFRDIWFLRFPGHFNRVPGIFPPRFQIWLSFVLLSMYVYVIYVCMYLRVSLSRFLCILSVMLLGMHPALCMHAYKHACMCTERFSKDVREFACRTPDSDPGLWNFIWNFWTQIHDPFRRRTKCFCLVVDLVCVICEPKNFWMCVYRDSRNVTMIVAVWLWPWQSQRDCHRKVPVPHHHAAYIFFFVVRTHTLKKNPI